ncbi:hypothetical protein Tco_0469482 [Tanacetum coccineum]
MAVYKELDDSLVRATNTASSLEEEQDSGNIAKTQSKATPNESSSLGTISVGSPRRQETMGDTIAQTRKRQRPHKLKRLLVSRGGSRSLNKKKRSRTHRLKRLYKGGLTARVESSRDEESLGDDASKQGRINAIDVDEDITLVNDQDDAGMFDVNTLTGVEVLAEQEVATKDVNLTVDEVTLAQALASLKSVKPKVKANVVEEPKIASKLQAEFDEDERLAREKDEAKVALTEEWDDIQAKVDVDYQLAQRLQVEKQEQFTTEQKVTLFKELLEKRRKHFAAKRAEEKSNKPPTKTQWKKIMITYLKNMEEIVEVDDDQEATKITELMKIVPDEEEVAIDAIHLATKPPTIVDCKIHKEGKKNYY